MFTVRRCDNSTQAPLCHVIEYLWLAFPLNPRISDELPAIALLVPAIKIPLYILLYLFESICFS